MIREVLVFFGAIYLPLGFGNQFGIQKTPGTGLTVFIQVRRSWFADINSVSTSVLQLQLHHHHSCRHHCPYDSRTPRNPMHLNRTDLNLRATTTSLAPHPGTGQICKNPISAALRCLLESKTDRKSEIYSFNNHSLCTIMRKSASYPGEQCRFKFMFEMWKSITLCARFIV